MKPDRKKKPGKPGSRKDSAPSGNGPRREDRNRRSVGDAEPSSGFAHTPIWLIVILGGLFYWAQLYVDQHGGGFSPLVYEPFEGTNEVYAANPKSDVEMVMARGRAQYETLCGVCHQGTGSGSPGIAPPLAGSEWVIEPNPARLIRIPILGLSGPIEVMGQSYNMNMVGLGAALENDEDLAALLTYIRQAWGNNAPPVTPEQVRAVREEIGTRTHQTTAAELLQIPVPPPAL